MRVAVIGAGSFGTVLADIAAHNHCDVRSMHAAPSWWRRSTCIIGTHDIILI